MITHPRISFALNCCPRRTHPARTEMQEYLVAQKVVAVLLEKEKEQAAMEERRKEEQRTDPHR